MKLLLDTHVFLWFISGDSRLSTSWTDAIRKQENEVYLSAVSCWEVIIKHALGKLPLPEPPVPISRSSAHETRSKVAHWTKTAFATSRRFPRRTRTLSIGRWCVRLSNMNWSLLTSTRFSWSIRLRSSILDPDANPGRKGKFNTRWNSIFRCRRT